MGMQVRPFVRGSSPARARRVERPPRGRPGQSLKGGRGCEAETSGADGSDGRSAVEGSEVDAVPAAGVGPGGAVQGRWVHLELVERHRDRRS